MTTKTTKPAKAPEYKLITGTTAIETAITSIQTRGKKLDRDIQIAALSCMDHHAKHGDVTLINRLIDAMPKGSRVNALRDMIENNGAVSYDEKSKTFMHDKTKTFDLEAASAMMWTEYKPEAPYVPFDAQAAVKALFKKVKEADPARGDKVSKEQAAAITTLAASMGIEA